jgi:hypothetical protein
MSTFCFEGVEESFGSAPLTLRFGELGITVDAETGVTETSGVISVARDVNAKA